MNGLGAGMLTEAEAEPAEVPDPAVFAPPCGPDAVSPEAPVSATSALAAGDAGLAALRERARMARTRLGDQSLPIANQSSRLVMKLLGG